MSDSEQDSQSQGSYSSESEEEDDRMSYSSESTESGDDDLDKIKNDADNALLYETIKTYLKTEHPDEYVQYKDKIKNIVGNGNNNNSNSKSKKSKKYSEKPKRKGVKDIEIRKSKHSHSGGKSNKLDEPPSKRGRGRPKKGEDSVPLSRMTKKELQAYCNEVQEKLSKYEKKYMKSKINNNNKKDKNDKEEKMKDEKKEKEEESDVIIPNDINGREIVTTPIDPYYI